jgi:hypothetical protein
MSVIYLTDAAGDFSSLQSMISVIRNTLLLINQSPVFTQLQQRAAPWW